MTSIVNELSIQLPIVMDDDLAAQIAEKLLYMAWTSREQFEIQISNKYLYLDAGDVLQVESDGNIYIMRILDIDVSLPGLLKIRATAERASLYSSSAVGGTASYPPQTLIIYGDTIIAIMDIPALRDEDAASGGFYIAGYGEKANWTGGVVYKSVDDGASWNALLAMSTAAKMGVATDVLSDYTQGDWDTDNSVNISMNNGTLSSDTEINVLNGANIAAFGTDDRWEIIQWQTATLEGDGTYTLTNLIRGRLGTEHAKDSHTVNDVFVVLDSTNVSRASIAYSSIGSTIKYKAVSSGQYLQDITTEHDIDIDDGNAKPWSVVQIHGERDGSNNLTIGWQRRSRYTAQILWTPQLGEDSELYDILIKDGANTIRIIQASTNSAEYTAAQQTADGFTSGDPVTVEIYQVSATIGRGYPAGETI